MQPLARLFFLTDLFMAVRISDSSIDWKIHKPDKCIEDDSYTGPNLDERDIFISLAITDVYDISESDMEFGLQIRLREVWMDKTMRLEEANLSKPQIVPNHVSGCIWKPDTIFWNMKSGYLYDITKPNSDLKIIPGGYLYRFSRYHLTTSCPMNFRRYPLDTQFCHLRIALLSNSDNEARLKWMGTDEDPQYFLGKWKAVRMRDVSRSTKFSVFSVAPTSKIIKLATGNYTQLHANFVLTRHLTASLVNTYIPSFLLVSISWVSFWIDPDAVPGRVTLGVTSILTLATQIVYARSGLPPLDYMTALDVWLFACLIMVFSSLIEFTLANRYGKASKTSKKEITKPVDGKRKTQVWAREIQAKMKVVTPMEEKQLPATLTTPPLEVVLQELVLLLRELNSRNSATQPKSKKDNPIDRVSRILFPSSAFVFVFSYWIYFLK